MNGKTYLQDNQIAVTSCVENVLLVIHRYCQHRHRSRGYSLLYNTHRKKIFLRTTLTIRQTLRALENCWGDFFLSLNYDVGSNFDSRLFSFALSTLSHSGSLLLRFPLRHFDVLFLAYFFSSLVALSRFPDSIVSFSSVRITRHLLSFCFHLLCYIIPPLWHSSTILGSSEADHSALPVHPSVAEGRSTNLTDLSLLCLCIHHTNTDSNRWSRMSRTYSFNFTLYPRPITARTLYSELLAPPLGSSSFDKVHAPFRKCTKKLLSKSNYLSRRRSMSL